jgi:hypothetical protein
MNRLYVAIPVVFFSLLCITGLTPRLWATEGGWGSYPNGAEDFMAGALPPPGTYLLNYFSYYHAPKVNDNRGGSAPVDVDVECFADSVRLLHMTKKQVFGANWAMHVLVPFVKVHASTPRGVDSKTGVGDIVVNPFLLGWHKNDIANIGRNYWTFEPVFAVTYLSSSGYEVSAKFMYDFNTKNTATDYLSGQEFHVDYTLGKKIDNMNIGIGGYYYKQITDDSLDGDTVHDKKGQVFAFGPQFRYGLKNMAFTVKYQWETLAKNRPQGEQFWFKFMYAF